MQLHFRYGIITTPVFDNLFEGLPSPFYEISWMISVAVWKDVEGDLLK